MPRLPLPLRSFGAALLAIAGLGYAPIALGSGPGCASLPKSSGRAPDACRSALPAAAPSAAARPQIAGDLSFIKTNFPAPLNVTTAPLPTLTLTTLGPLDRLVFAMDFDNAATTLWAIDNGSREYGTINQSTGAFTVVGTVTGIPALDNTTGLKFDPSSPTVYLSTSSGLYTLDLGTGAATLVGALAGIIIDIAIDNSGQMYGHEIVNDQLVLIDKATAGETVIGPTGLNANFAQGMDFDPSDGTLYGYAFVVTPVQQAELVSFNLQTGAATVLDSNANELEGAIKVAVPTAEPVANEIDAPLTGAPTNGNHVFDPNETVLMRPTWMNTSASPLSLTGTLTNFTGPGNAGDYAIVDDTADYGSVAAGASAQCTDCYALSITNASRPVQHWDATVDETLALTASQKTWTLHIGGSFADVDPLLGTDPFYPSIETIFHFGVTAGCGSGNYCPLSNNLRREMAPFLLKAFLGAGYTPPDCAGVFDDVPCPPTPEFPYSNFIEDLKTRGVTVGCQVGPPALYCPDDNVTRAQMAPFLLKTLEGPTYVPPDCAGLFDDVPCPPTPEFPFSNFIEQLSVRGITAGCQVGPPALYCPDNPVTRQEMAAFLTITFGLVLYGP
jgi:hypothetical protein